MAGKGRKLGSNTPEARASVQHPALPHPQPAYPHATYPTTAGAFGQGVFGAHDPIGAELAAWQYRPGMPEGHAPEAQQASARLRAPKRKA
jgi:hypothetical protein